MAQKNNTLIVFGSLVVIGSVGYYLWSKSKKSKGEGSSEPTPADNSKPKEDKPIVAKPPVSTNPSGSGKIPHYLEYSEGGVTQFQDWLDTYYPKWLNGKKLNHGKGYGVLGPSTKSAFDTYGKEYDNWLKQQKVIKDSTITQTNIDAIKRNFPKGKSVIATATFKGFASQFRNGDWFNTDSNGNALPSKEFKATASIGDVYEVAKDGSYVVVKLYTPLQSDGWFVNDLYNFIRVKPSLIK